jgi:hypothetical protein
MRDANDRPSVYPLRFVAPFLAPLVVKYGNPKLCRVIMDLLPYKALHDCRDIVDIMDRTSREIYAEKKQALADGDEVLERKIGQGKDIMSILSKHLRELASTSTCCSYAEHPHLTSAGQYVRFRGRESVR